MSLPTICYPNVSRSPIHRRRANECLWNGNIERLGLGDRKYGGSSNTYHLDCFARPRFYRWARHEYTLVSTCLGWYSLRSCSGIQLISWRIMRRRSGRVNDAISPAVCASGRCARVDKVVASLPRYEAIVVVLHGALPALKAMRGGPATRI